ncbi:sugar transferase [candidate division KSB1 bacterium]|nr:sugar transferase [candidate division KSB1 bacterium]
MIRHFFHHKHGTTPDFYHSRNYFQHRLEVEKKRADRKVEKLTVVQMRFETEVLHGEFTSNELEKSKQTIGTLIFDSIRSEDVASWFDDRTLVLMLPDTNADQARQFIDRMMGRLRSQTGDDRVMASVLDYIRHTMFLYPDSGDVSNSIADRSKASVHDILLAQPIFLNGQFTEPEIGRDPRRSKRLFDVIVALALLIVTAPMMAIVALAVKLTTPGPVIFRQKRVGYAGRTFTVFKFRTMYENANETIHKKHILGKIISKLDIPIKLQQDDRITSLGRWLRRTCIDELPQLINVLRGEMSMVGPRPHPVYEVDAYALWYRRRLSVKPGMTGVWQVKGHPCMPYSDAIRLDLDYVDHWRLRDDAKIMLRTVPVVLMG